MYIFNFPKHPHKNESSFIFKVNPVPDRYFEVVYRSELLLKEKREIKSVHYKDKKYLFFFNSQRNINDIKLSLVNSFDIYIRDIFCSEANLNIAIVEKPLELRLDEKIRVYKALDYLYIDSNKILFLCPVNTLYIFDSIDSLYLSDKIGIDQLLFLRNMLE